ncbi:MAG: carboxypeptidase regulatory-like domain-containing protein [Candidatus Acidiferrales bacterium]
MELRRIGKYLRLFCAVGWLATCSLASATEHHGQVTFNTFPVPGVTVTATQGDKKFVAITDQDGLYSFPDLTDGTWTIEIEMVGFSTIKDQVLVGGKTPPAPPWELKMLALDAIKTEAPAAPPAPGVAAPQVKSEETKPPDKTEPAKPQDKNDQTKPPDKNAPAKPPVAAPAAAEAPQESTDQRAADGFLINGSTNNGAASPFAQLAAFGNSRSNGRSLYNGGVGLIINNSVLNASPYSLSGFSTPKPNTNQITGVANFGGPIKIGHLFKTPPSFVVGYVWTRNAIDSTQSGIVPTLAERSGDLSQAVNSMGQPLQFVNPATGLPFLNNMVPVSTQAAALLNLFPKPNIVGNPDYNYQIPVISNTHQDALNLRLNKTLNRKDSLNGLFSFQSTRSSNPNLFGFVDTTSSLGLNTSATWTHRYNQHFFQTVTYRFSRQATLTIPYWENRQNISGMAGITGNNQSPVNWGPPTLGFSTGDIFPALTDGISAHNRNQTSAVSYAMNWFHRSHNVKFGGDFRRQEFNYLSQQNPRGTFTFTGTATSGVVNGQPVPGSDLADFLLGIPDASSIAFGNADKYFRQSVYDLYINDDWRVTPQLSVNGGIRWDYGAPVTELFGRMVNLDIGPGFAAVAPVIGNNPTGSVTGQTYPTSLVRPDKHAIQPSIGIAWRPISGSSIVIRAGYGVNFDTSVYSNIALYMAQQAPLSTSVTVANSAACPLTLAIGFNTCPSTTATSFAIDPNFRVGYVQTWQLSVQKDLPWSLQMTAIYFGNKGTRSPQEFLPNTNPPNEPVGFVPPCPTCPVGFEFLTSNGNSHREAGTLQMRRRLHNGLTATATYTFSKSIDDASALGGGQSANQLLAQNWLNLNAERGLSTFDQRHLLSTQIQYSTGMGLGGKTLMSGWKGKLYKEWTILTNITVGSGLPQTPIYPVLVTGTGFSGSVRPNVVPGQSLYAASPGFYLNPAAFTAPVSGQWGDAGRDSITGPSQFSLNASLARTFRMSDRLNLDLQFAATNPLNHPAYTSWNVTFLSPQFGLPASVNAMRSIRTTLRLRF